MTTVQVVVHLITGDVLEGPQVEDPSEADVVALRGLMQRASGSDTGYLTLDIATGWTCIPIASVLYAELRERELGF